MSWKQRYDQRTWSEDLAFRDGLSLLRHAQFLVTVRDLLSPTAILGAALIPLYVLLVIPIHVF